MEERFFPELRVSSVLLFFEAEPVKKPEPVPVAPLRDTIVVEHRDTVEVVRRDTVILSDTVIAELKPFYMALKPTALRRGTRPEYRS